MKDTIVPPPPPSSASSSRAIELDDADLQLVVDPPARPLRLSKPPVLARWEDLESLPPAAMSIVPVAPTSPGKPVAPATASAAAIEPKRGRRWIVPVALAAAGLAFVAMPRQGNAPALSRAGVLAASIPIDEQTAATPTPETATVVLEPVAIVGESPAAEPEAPKAGALATAAPVEHAAREHDAGPRPRTTPKESEAAEAPAAPATVESIPKPFDAAAAKVALGPAVHAAEACGDGSGGSVRVVVTFAPSGRVTRAAVDGSGLGPRVGSCVASKFYGLRIPAFDGDAVSVSKVVAITGG